MMMGGSFPGRQYIPENQVPQLESGLFNQEVSFTNIAYF